MNGQALIAIGCYVGIWVTGWILEREDIRALGEMALAGMACLASLSRVEVDPNPVWSLLAIASGLGAGFAMRRLFPRPNRRERRAMRALFGEETLWQKLINDPRLGPDLEFDLK